MAEEGDRFTWRDAIGIVDLKGRKAEDLIRDLRDGWPDVFETRNCGTCQWWSRPDQWSEGWGICELGRTESGEPINKATKAAAQDYEGYKAFLHTRPDFACVQWQAKETADG